MTNSRSVSITGGGAIALLLVILSVSAQPVAAATVNEAVGSSHTTFGAAGGESPPQTLTNLTVSGSGTDAVVRFDTQISASYPIDAGSGSTISDVAGSNDGAITGATWVNSPENFALEFDGSDDYVQIDDADELNATGDFAFEVDFRADTNNEGRLLYKYADGYGYFLSLKPDGTLQGRVFDDGTAYAVSTSTDYADGSYHTVNFSRSGDTLMLSVDGSVRDTTVATSADLSNTGELYIGQDLNGKKRLDGYVESVDIFTGSITDPSSATYVSAAHNVSDAETARINITELSDASVDVTVRTVEGDVLGETTITSAGVTDVSLASTDSNQLEVELSVSGSGQDPEFVLADESILFDPSQPTATLQSPADGAELTESSVDFSIDVSDADFGTAQGDSVTATLQLRGPGESSWTDYGTDTATSNSTVTVSEEITTGGEWEYRFRLEDSYGESTTTASRSVFVPAELEVRSALPPHELINDVNLTVRFYEDGGEERVFQQTPTDGTISLAGLPTTNFVVTVRANESYAYRRIVLDSLYEQSTVYLLPDNATSSQIVFQLDDRTGRFDAAQTTLYIEAPITRDFNGDGNETTRYVTIAGDTFGGSEQFPVTLENNQRYRLRVENENGETRVLGSYTTAGDAVAVLPLGQVVIDSDVGKGGVAFDAAIREADDGSKFIRLVYRDPEMATQSLSLEVTNPDSNTTLRPNSTMEGPYGRYIETVPLPAGANDSATYVVKWSAERNASVVGGQERVGNVNAFVGDIDIDPAIRGLIGYGAIIGVTGLVIIRSPRVAGVVGVGTAVIVSALGVVSIAPSALGIGGAIAVLAFVGGGGR